MQVFCDSPADPGKLLVIELTTPASSALCNYGANACTSSVQARSRSWGGIICSWKRHPDMHCKGPTLFCAFYVQPGPDTFWHLHGVEVAFASVLLFLSSAQLSARVVLSFAFQHRPLLMLDAVTPRFAAF
jgi:hypothetical protein